MATKYQITSAQKEEIELARKANRDKRTEAKLKVLIMRAVSVGRFRPRSVGRKEPIIVGRR